MILQSASRSQRKSFGGDSCLSRTFAVTHARLSAERRIDAGWRVFICATSAERLAVQRRTPKATVRCNGLLAGLLARMQEIEHQLTFYWQ